VALPLVLASSGCIDFGDDDDDAARTDFVTVTPPAGWSSSSDGLEVAENAADLGADAPAGPVIRVEVGELEGADYVAMAEAEFAGEQADVEFGEVEGASLSGLETESIALRAEGRVVQYLIVHPEGTVGAVAVLDTPEDRYEETRQLVIDAVSVSG
jgi:hypothetical protein